MLDIRRRSTLLHKIIFLIVINFFFHPANGVSSSVLSIHPTRDVFIVHSFERNIKRQENDTNIGEEKEIFMLNGCPHSLEQVVSSSIGSKSYSSLLPSLHSNFHCGIGLRVVDRKVNIDKPYVDVIVHGYIEWLQFFKTTLCITFELINDRGYKIKEECLISMNGNQTCLLRLNIPLLWFPTPDTIQIDDKMSRKNLQNYQKLKGSYSISPLHCYPPNRQIPEKDDVLLKTQMINLENTILDERYNWSISLKSHPNISIENNSLSTFFIHFNYQKYENKSSEIDKLIQNGTLYLKIKIILPKIFNLHTASTLSPDVWGMRIERDDILKKKITFILWLNNYEAIKNGWEGTLFGMTIQSNYYNKNSVETIFSKNIDNKNNNTTTLQWSLQGTVIKNNITNETKIIDILNNSKKRQVNTSLLIYDDEIEKLGIICKHNQIINTATLSNLQISSSLKIFGIYNSGKFYEMSSNVQCTSSEPKILKTSPSCGMIYVDGSESRGSNDIIITAKYHNIYNKANFIVWYPKFPLKIWIEDDILNSIQDWSVAVWKWLSRRKKRREAKTFACRERFQQTEVKLLSNFYYVNQNTGEEIYLSQNKEKYFDITPLVMNKLTIENESIADIRRIHDKLIILPKKNGVSKVVFKNSYIPIELASTTITISNEPVSINNLWLEPIINIIHHLETTHNEQFFQLHKIVKNEFNSQYERGILNIGLKFSDKHYLPLADVPNHEYIINIQSNDGERILAINKKYNHGVPELIALSDISDVQLTVNIKSQETCKGIDAAPLINGQLVIPIFFPIEDSKRIEVSIINEDDEESKRIKQVEELFKKVESIEDDKKNNLLLNVHPFILFIFLLLSIILIIQIINCSGDKLHNGYEKLVAPIFARLNSNTSLSDVQKIEDSSKEWIWLPRNSTQKPSKNSSFGSQYSNKSTVGLGEKFSSGSSPDDNLNKSISVSYKGSEISVFLSPNASMAVPERNPQSNNYFQYASWRTGRKNGKNKSYYCNMESSNSETNLKKWNTDHRLTHPIIPAHGISNYEYNQPSEKIIADWREYKYNNKEKNKLVHIPQCSFEEPSRASPTYDSDEELLLDRPMKTGDLIHKYFLENGSITRSIKNDTTSLSSQRTLGQQQRSIDKRSFHVKESVA
uniref:TMEM132 domain-containing protein n=1 Tax=Strongyloides stercoralis TaxID=6248 RepID=A0A0K0E889_STRER